MIRPIALIQHAQRLTGSGPGRTAEIDLRRGTSAAYYAVFHDLTDRATRHLIGSSAEHERNKIRRVWTHGELARSAAMVLDRARTLTANPNAPTSKEAGVGGPLIDIAASDADLVEALQILGELRDQRQRADYDHEARFNKTTAVSACDDAARAREQLNRASAASREALFTLLTLHRSDFRER